MEPLFQIREINQANEPEIALVAQRMRLTLMEVVGEKEGSEMYSMEWLVDRVREHLDPNRLNGAVFIAETPEKEIVGHTIVRIEKDDNGEFGYFSTFYVAPEARQMGVAKAFVETGEAWMRGRGASRFVTNTAEDNEKLHRLLEGFGYAIVYRADKMVQFSKTNSSEN